MLYTELIRLWSEAVGAVDRRDWEAALTALGQISEPTARTLFTTASILLTLGRLELTIKALDQTIAKDERLAVGFFQRAAVHMLADRLDEALGDCALAQKHMRGNSVIDYRQLGLRYKLYSWQVLYNMAAVQTRLCHWDTAEDLLLEASQQQGGARGVNLKLSLDSLARLEVLKPLLVPEGEVFRPRKQDVEQLEQRDFLGKPKVISSVIPNDDFGGFEPLRLQKPGYYEPKAAAHESRYMRVRSRYTARGPGELQVLRGEPVFMLDDSGSDGQATVIYDGQKVQLPLSVLEPIDVNKPQKKDLKSVPKGIPLPPDLKPPMRPQSRASQAAPPLDAPGNQFPPPVSPSTPVPPALTSPSSPLPAPQPHSGDEVLEQSEAQRTARKKLAGGSVEESEVGDSVVVKVHYRFTVALSVPVKTPYSKLRERIAHKLGQPSNQLRLRHRERGSQVMKPLSGVELQELLEGAENGRATLWCQNEDPLLGRPILYQVVALYDYTAQGPEDLEFNEGDTIDILSEVNEEWMEGHVAGSIGIFPRCFVYREADSSVGSISSHDAQTM
ncbi:NADPH oxidase activator 1 [Amia ocellicauda]|uniref:NADPH oxidase activator 1 n=1 Tax=Amia ocellicauda TaxID=2972642 RepID=UPI0034640F25